MPIYAKPTFIPLTSSKQKTSSFSDTAVINNKDFFMFTPNKPCLLTKIEISHKNPSDNIFCYMMYLMSDRSNRIVCEGSGDPDPSASYYTNLNRFLGSVGLLNAGLKYTKIFSPRETNCSIILSNPYEISIDEKIMVICLNDIGLENFPSNLSSIAGLTKNIGCTINLTLKDAI